MKALEMFLFARIQCMNYIRQFYSSKINIPEYLLDRVRPAEEVLKNLKSNDLERLNTLKMNHNQLLEMGHNVPNQPNDEYFLDLLCCSSYSQQLKVNTFYFKKEKKKEHAKLKKQHKVRLFNFLKKHRNLICQFYNLRYRNFMLDVIFFLCL